MGEMLTADKKQSGLLPFSAQDFARRVFSLNGHSTRDYDHDFKQGDSRISIDHMFGDHALNPDFAPDIRNIKLRDAAVLVPVVETGQAAKVILTQRASHLRHHSGQVAFPGGKVDVDDISEEFTALREAEEEIGLGYNSAQILGQLPHYLSGSGFAIRPVLALVKQPYQLRANPDEVADIFEVPLSHLMNPANHHLESKMIGGQERHYYVIPFEKRIIWGVTAGIIRGIYERLYR